MTLIKQQINYHAIHEETGCKSIEIQNLILNKH